MICQITEVDLNLALEHKRKENKDICKTCLVSQAIARVIGSEVETWPSDLNITGLQIVGENKMYFINNEELAMLMNLFDSIRIGYNENSKIEEIKCLLPYEFELSM